MADQESIVSILQNQILDLVETNSLSFDNLDASGLIDTIEAWRSAIFGTANNGYYTIIFPFAKRYILWPSRSFGSLDSLCFFSAIETTMWMSHIFLPDVEVMWDVGSRYGIDALVMSATHPRSQIIGFEPDPIAFSEFRSTVRLNELLNITCHNVALGLEDKTCTFTRVLGNTTASHINGCRDHYGPTESFKVIVMEYSAFDRPGFAKINVEGFEKILIPGFNPSLIKSSDLCIEIHSREDMLAVWNTAIRHDLNVYSQRHGFRKINKIEDMPLSNKQGYVLLSCRERDYLLSVREISLEDLIIPIAS